eukprot:5985108-Prymnesium_polylepis.1
MASVTALTSIDASFSGGSQCMTPQGSEVARKLLGPVPEGLSRCVCEPLAAVCVEFILKISAEHQSVHIARVEQFGG